MSESVDPTGVDVDEMGPVDYIVVEFPGSKMTGEGLPLLVDLVDRGIIRILDFAFVMKELDGSVHAMAISDFDGDGQLDLAVFEGASSGLLDDGDLDEVRSLATSEERQLFDLLITVKNVGPATAVAILSGAASPQILARLIAAGDVYFPNAA